MSIALAEKPSKNERFVEKRVWPILRKRCVGCHNQQLKNAGISFLDRGSLLAGGGHGPAIVPRNPQRSYLLRTLSHEGEIRMPPGPKLPEREIRVLREWILRGATLAPSLRNP